MERDHSDGEGRPDRSLKKKKVKCWSYGKLGHVRKDYRLRKGGREDKPESNNFQKNMVDAGSTTFEDKDALSV